MTPRRWSRPLGALATLIAAAACAAPANAAQADRAFALSGSNLLEFNPASPSTITKTTPLVNVNPSETLVGIDVRPQNGQLYGFGVNATSNTGTVYMISPETGWAAPTGFPGQVAFTTDGVTAVDFPDPATVGYGVDFNPAVDRLRVTAGALNFRVNPNLSLPLDGDNTGLTAGSVSGTNPDGPTNGGTTTVDASAYTNNVPVHTNSAVFTTLYTLDAASNTLYRQSNPNTGLQTSVGAVQLSGSPLDFTSISGFDIETGVNAPSNNAAVPSGSATAVLNVGGTTGLYRINLVTAVATFIGNVGNGTLPIQGLALQRPLSEAGFPAIGLVSGGANLVRFDTATPTTIGTAPIGAGLTGGETLAAITWSPQTGQLFGFGVNSANNTGTLYYVDPQTFTLATVIPSISWVQTDGTTKVPLANPNTTRYAIDFNPSVDRVRITNNAGLNARMNPNTFAPVDGDNVNPGTQTDGALNGFLAGGGPGIIGTSYTNSWGRDTVIPPATALPTTQYSLDPTGNRLYVQNPPNSGTLTLGKEVKSNGSVLDFAPDSSGMDIPADVAVTTGNAPAVGEAYAALKVGNDTGLYSLDLCSAKATSLGTIGTGAAPMWGVTLGRAYRSAPTCLPADPVVNPPGNPPVVKPPVGTPKDTTKPVVSKVSVKSAKKRKVTIAFTVSEAGTAKIKVVRQTKGRRSGGRCSAKAKKGKRCTITKNYGTVTRTVSKAGKVTVTLSGKVGKRKLALGRIQVQISYADKAGNKAKTVRKNATVKK